MPGPLVEVDDPRRHPLRVQQHPGHVDGRGEQLRRHAGGQRTEAVVGRDEIAVPVDDHRRVRLVPLQDALQGRADRPEPGVAEVRLRIGRRVPRRQQQGVALPERNLQRLGQAHHHGAARDGAPAFDEANVPLRGSGPQREFQLADPAAAAPFAQRGGQAAGLAGPAGAATGPCLGGHTAVFTSPPASWPFPRGNCRAAAPPAPSKTTRTRQHPWRIS